MEQPLRFAESGRGPVVLWVHGFPLTSDVFEPQMSIGGFRHIAPDLPGFGQTPATSDALTMADYSRKIVQLMDQLSIDRCAVAGLSMGGYIAMQMLRDVPARISALLLLDTRETADSDEAKAGREKQAAEAKARGIESIIESMLPKMVRDVSYAPAVREIMSRSSTDGVVAALHAMARRPDSADTLRAVSVPTFIAVGEHDAITPLSDARRMQSLVEGSELAVIPNAAHLANFERSGDFNRSVTAFLRKAG
ncbi:MAG TPA: alpha/beta hydrolase [Thermoanaerobaculia bacterium]|nr:alpha/beta hydrolase [Thermoanaerobaculia bacterium]